MFLTARGLDSAAAYASKLNKVVKYRPKNLTMLSANPVPSAAPAAGLDGVVLEPRVLPVDWKPALDFPGPLAASDEALETAERSAEGFAPRIVSATEPFLKTRNVGMLSYVSRST